MGVEKMRSVEPVDVQSISEILDTLKSLNESIPTGRDRSPGPFLPHPDFIDFHVLDKSSSDFILRISNGFLLKQGGELMGVGSRPTVNEALDVIDSVIDKTSDSMPPEKKNAPQISNCVRLD